MNKKYQYALVWLLLMCMLFSGVQVCSFAVKAKGEDTFTFDGVEYKRSKDVPAIYIEGAYGVNINNYVSCTVVAMDRIGGEMKEAADTNASIRIRGNSTSNGAKRPYNIKFSSNINLFGMGKGKRYCLIANMYDPTLIRNHTVFEFARELGMAYTPDSMLVDVYFNGKYVGCYQLCDAVTADEGRVDIDCDAGDFIIERDARDDAGTTYFTTMLGHRFGINEPENTTSAQSTQIQNQIRKAEQALQSGDYEQVEKYFDIDSMIDMYICMEFFKNVDIIVGSTRFYCKDGVIYGGPVWDFDLSAGNCSSDYYLEYNNFYGDSAEGLWAIHIWFDDLLVYDEYKQAMYDRYLELQDLIVNLYDDNVLGENAIDRTIAGASVSIKRNFSEAAWRPWQNYSELMRVPDSSYELNVEYFRAWLRRRNEWLLDYWGIASRVQPKPKEHSLTYTGQYLLGISPNTTVSEFQDCFKEPVTCNTVGEYVRTGDVLRGEGASYYMVVEGDLNQDGQVSVVDYFLLKQLLYKSYDPERASYLAACFGQDVPSEIGCEKMKQYCIYRELM